MKLIEAVRAYRAIEEMLDETWDTAFLAALCRLKAQLADDYLAFCGEELALVMAAARRDEPGRVAIAADGSFTFKDDAARRRYLEAHHRLEQRECDDIAVVDLPAVPRLRGAWYAALSPCCRFDHEKGENHYGNVT